MEINRYPVPCLITSVSEVNIFMIASGAIAVAMEKQVATTKRMRNMIFTDFFMLSLSRIPKNLLTSTLAPIPSPIQNI